VNQQARNVCPFRSLNETPIVVVAVKLGCMVEANGKKTFYVQNGNAYQSAEVVRSNPR